MQRKCLVLILIFTTFLTLFWGLKTMAQIRSTDAVLSISPQNPSPNQNVTATIASRTIDLDKSNIVWYINGQENSSGIGKKTFYFKVGNSGINTNLSVTIETISGQSISKNINITPAGLDLLMEAYDAYTPPFYKGKALPPSQGKFKIVAMPNFSNTINSSNLSYTWIQDGNTQLKSSGWGKNYFIFQNSYLDKGNTVEVKISNITNKSTASGKINLKTHTPKILFYENDPILGTKWEKSLDTGFFVKQGGTIIQAEPYFFSPKNIAEKKLSFEWYLNGKKIQTPSSKNILSVKPESGKSGNAVLKLIVNNTDTLFQTLEKQITINF